MKKHICIIVMAAAVVTTSCRKERTCECTLTTTDTNPGSAVTVTKRTTTMDNQKKNEFELRTNCHERTETLPYTQAGNTCYQTNQWDCELN